MTRALVVLAVKDLRLHGAGVAAYAAGVALLAWLLLWLLPPLEGQGRPPAVLVPIALYFVLVCASWLVERERSRETFALLRALPVSDLDIVGSKFLAYAVMQVFGFALALGVSPAVRALAPIHLVTAFAGLLLFASLALAVQLSFAGRRAMAGPLLLVVGVAAAGARVARSPARLADVARWWADPWMHVLAWVVVAAAVAALVLGTWLRFRAQDTQDLIG